MSSQKIEGKSKKKRVRLRCKFRPLHDAYFVNGEIVERDSDVEFQCQDGGVLKAHKIILSSASTFFVQLFENQKCGKMTTVCVPDIDTETMQLILKLAYREKVSMSMESIKDVRDHLNLFGMEWKNFVIELLVETHGDTNLEGPDENFPERNPNELKSYPGPSDNLIQSSIALNKRPRFEKPSKGKQRPIRKSPPSKKDNQIQQQSQIVKDQTTDNPEEQQSKSPLSPSKTVPQDKQPQIVLDLARYDPEKQQPTQTSLPSPTSFKKAIKDWINSLKKSAGGQQDRILTGDQQPTSSNGNVQQQNEQQTTPNYKQILRQQKYRPNLYSKQTNVCTICNYTCEDQEKFNWHQDRHIGIMQFTCYFCPTVFETERKAKAHEYDAHQYEPNFFKDQREQQISRSSGVKAATNIRSTNKIRNDSPAQKEKLSLVRTRARDQYRKHVSVNYANLAKYRSRHTKPNQGNANRPSKPSSTLQKQVSAIANNVSSTSTISWSTPTPKSSTISWSTPKSKSSTDSTGKLLFKNKDIPLGAGEVEDCEEKEVAILKGIFLAWTYFCAKCKQETESIQKAHDHYVQCCEDEIPEFVNSVHRHSYNCYGSIKCCRCFKGYSLNSSFSRHCERSHSEFKEKFSVGNDDKILCDHCKGKFSDPQQFDDHLDANENCPRGENSSINNELEVGEASRRQRLAKSKCNNSRPHRAKTTATVARAGPSYSLRVVTRPKLTPDNQATYSAGENPSEVRRRQRLAKSKCNNSRPNRAKTTTTVARTGPSTRVKRPKLNPDNQATYYSAGENPSKMSRRQRLAKSKWNNSHSRPHLVETTVARTGPGPRVKRPKLNPESEATYSPGQCPICKEDVAKIVEHIKAEHGKFDFNIVQVSNMAMKCKTCNTSFAMCDLLTHICQVSQRQKQPQQQAKPAVTKTQTAVVTQGGDQEDFIPVNGIGKSPIDVMECSDLLNINTIRKAFNCQVCGKKGEKMGFGAECLKSHNIHRCPLCFNTYSSIEDYTKHLKVCHGCGTGAGFYCPCCPRTKVVANIGSIASHMNSAHWLPIIRIIDRQNEIISNSQHSGQIIDNNPTMTRPAKNADKNESNLDVTLGNIFDETRGIKDDEDVKTTTDPEVEVEVVNDNDKSEDKTQTIETIENDDIEINYEENGEEDSQDSDEFVIIIDETEEKVEQEDLVLDLDPVASAK